MKKRFMAFTLAEVLITLSIIGIVAALTIPTLINNYQKKQYVTGLKKVYTQLSQVLTKMAADSGDINSIKGYFDYVTDSNTSKIQTGDAIAKYFNVIKNCKLDTGCFHTFNSYYDGTSPSSVDYENNALVYKFITNDGVSYAFIFWNGFGDALANCKNAYSIIQDAPTYAVCADVYVYVNGSKPPNHLGRDIFTFVVTSNKSPILYPSGGKYYQYYNPESDDFCSQSSIGNGKNGQYCTGRIMEKGWEMDY